MRLQSLKISAAARENFWYQNVLLFFTSSRFGADVENGSKENVYESVQNKRDTKKKNKNTVTNPHSVVNSPWIPDQSTVDERCQVNSGWNHDKLLCGVFLSLSSFFFRLSWTTEAEKILLSPSRTRKKCGKLFQFFNVDKFGLFADCVTELKKSCNKTWFEC